MGHSPVSLIYALIASPAPAVPSTLIVLTRGFSRVSLGFRRVSLIYQSSLKRVSNGERLADVEIRLVAGPAAHRQICCFRDPCRAAEHDHFSRLPQRMRTTMCRRDESTLDKTERQASIFSGSTASDQGARAARSCPCASARAAACLNELARSPALLEIVSREMKTIVQSFFISYASQPRLPKQTQPQNNASYILRRALRSGSIRRGLMSVRR
jgi:hypothetical protein